MGTAYCAHRRLRTGAYHPNDFYGRNTVDDKLGKLGFQFCRCTEACPVFEHGTSFGAPTELETELAELVIDRVPSIEIVRMVSSGTEATMSAISGPHDKT